MKAIYTNHIMTAMSAGVIVFGLSGCARAPHYNPNDFINPNRVVTKTVIKPMHIPNVHATFGLGNNPQVAKAYHQFIKNGIAPNINTAGFKTFAYSPYAHPIIACSPLHLCAVQLERGEIVNDIDVGDTKNWSHPTLALIGTPEQGSYQVIIKPKYDNTATDMVITTNKRTYNIGLVSKSGHYTHVANFYYPEETLQAQIARAKQAAKTTRQLATVAMTTFNLNRIDFDYRITGDHPVWRPVRVFDDGTKTFIQMPAVSAQVDLPVLYIGRHHVMQLVNYRYQRPYYIVDGLFHRAYLISGKGRHQIRVDIEHRHFLSGGMIE